MGNADWDQLTEAIVGQLSQHHKALVFMIFGWEAASLKNQIDRVSNNSVIFNIILTFEPELKMILIV